jgi:UDP-N-acetylglucosamine 3-dehydrogenase
MALRLGLVGHGRWGRNIERTLQSFADITLTVIAKGESPPPGLEGVLIATQSATHAETALPYIEAGIPTFIEKPMATTISDARRIEAAARRTGALVFVGHIFLYHPAFLAALELLLDLGDVRYLCCEGMNAQPRADSSVLWDWLPHDLSMALAILKREPESVTAWSLAGGNTPTAAFSKFQFGDIPVVCTTSWESPYHRRRTMIACQTATLVFDDKSEQRLTLYDRHGSITYPAFSDELPLTVEMKEFVNAARSGKTDSAHIQTGTAVVRAIAAAEESIRLNGQTVRL